MKKCLFITILLILIASVIWMFYAGNLPRQEETVSLSSVTIVLQNEEQQKEKASQEASGSIPIGVVPFVSQAPTGEWDDERFQNGCEEASIIMAYAWTTGKTYAKETAKKEIIDLAEFQEKEIGTALDTSAEDTAMIMKKYFNYEGELNVKRNSTLDDIKKELSIGNLVLVPAFGRALKNPNFTAPGPITHMLVIKGYDEKTDTFITNDPGTRKGEGYTYDAKLLYDAIWAYPTGLKHPEVPNLKTMEKVYIAVSKP